LSFDGAKLALIVRGALIVILRDDIPTISWPGHWDFPGGGRDGDETPLACVMRELREELDLTLNPDLVCWEHLSPNGHRQPTWFFVAQWDDLDLATVRLGDEGQRWQLMTTADYLAHPLAIPRLAQRLSLWLSLQAEVPAPSSRSRETAQ